MTAGREHDPTLVRIDCRRIGDFATLHGVFAEAFGFPRWYGNNMDAWIDVMSYLDDPAGGSAVSVPKGTVVVLQLEHARELRARARELFDAIIECSAFVNWRRIEVGEPALLALAFT